MKRVPIFVELIQSAAHANVQVCRKIMAELFRRNVSPLPFAANAADLRNVLSVLRARQSAPAIFVINTLWAEELLPEIDPLIGSTPVLFLMREIIAQTIVMHGSGSGPVTENYGGGDKLKRVLEKMSPRPNCIWTYGSKTALQVAGKAANLLVRFLDDGKFAPIEMHADAPSIAPDKAPAPPPPALTLVEPTRPKSAESGRIARLPIDDRLRHPAISPSGVHGLVEHLALSTVLMMMEMERKTGVLQVRHENELARIIVKDGRILYAEIEGNVPAGCDLGHDAIYHVLTWTTGRFDFFQQDVNVADQINTQITQLLMEGARRIDQPA